MFYFKFLKTILAALCLNLLLIVGANLFVSFSLEDESTRITIATHYSDIHLNQQSEHKIYASQQNFYALPNNVKKLKFILAQGVPFRSSQIYLKKDLQIKPFTIQNYLLIFLTKDNMTRGSPIKLA